MDQTESSPPQTEPGSKSGQKKNILIFCDGTGNKFVDIPATVGRKSGSNSNVVKLYTAMQIKNSQVAYYHPGLGTAGDPAAKSWIAKKWSVVNGLAFGWGFKDNVLDAYKYLMETYSDGDDVYMFGFSRGSYTVRALAGLLNGYGLLCPGNDGHLPYAWNEYVDQHDDRKRHHVKPNNSFKATFSRPGFRIHFMGIWDTVSSVGWVNTPLRLYSVAENPLIDIGRHAVSIDERRCFFRDNLWVGGDDSKLTKAPAIEHTSTGQDLLQIWFAGVHSDVGGGYLQEETVLSTIALKWLIGEAEKALDATKIASITPQMRDLVLGDPVTLPTGDDVLDEKIAALQPLYPMPKKSIIHKSLYGVWWLLELLPHRYYDKDDGKENWRTPLGMHRRIPSGSFIHSSVRERLEHTGSHYDPSNLKGGIEFLHLRPVSGQDSDSILVYRPHGDGQPFLNKAPVRIGVMVLVTALDLAAVAAVALVPVAAWWFLRHR